MSEKEIIITSEREREAFLKSMGIPSDKVISRRRHVILIGIVGLMILLIVFNFSELKALVFSTINDININSLASIIAFVLPGLFYLGIILAVFFIVKTVLTGPRY